MKKRRSFQPTAFDHLEDRVALSSVGLGATVQTLFMQHDLGGLRNQRAQSQQLGAQGSGSGSGVSEGRGGSQVQLQKVYRQGNVIVYGVFSPPRGNIAHNFGRYMVVRSNVPPGAPDVEPEGRGGLPERPLDHGGPPSGRPAGAIRPMGWIMADGECQI